MNLKAGASYTRKTKVQCKRNKQEKEELRQTLEHKTMKQTKGEKSTNDEQREKRKLQYI